MKQIPYNFDWKFTEGTGRFAMNTNGDAFVDLPHDYIINKPRTPDTPGGASTGFFPGGMGTYTKEFELPEEWINKTVLLNVDGAYMNSEVFLNNDKLNHHPYGYTAYQVDLTKRLRGDIKNSLRITTQSLQPSSRWYSGGGLYREVSLWVGGACYIHPWDIFVTTPEVSDEKAVVHAVVEITNSCDKARDGVLVIEAVSKNGEVVVKAGSQIVLQPNGKTPINMDLTIQSPKCWDVENPNLYTLRVMLKASGQEDDETTLTFGIRTIEIDHKNGFRLNGKTMKLLGGCIHHDNTLLGACAFPRAEERKIQLLKEAGYNAVRTAHNPPSKALLDACDRLGMLVLDESFDMWRTQKNPLDYHLYFEQWWQHDTRAMVMRDRNHPCIYCWSIGNEIPEFFGTSDGAYWTKVQADYVRSLDPTRPVTATANGMTAAVPGKPPARHNFKNEMQGKPRLGIPTDESDVWGEQTRDPASALDIVGYNYLYGRYAYDKNKFPDRIIHATETHSFYTYDYWKAMLENDHVIGDFIWVAYDNLGEGGAGRVIYDLEAPMNGLIGGYPWLSCYQGDFDLDGNRRPQSYYRKIMWGLDSGIHMFTTHPSMTGKPFYGMGWHWEEIQQTWSFESENIGKPVKVQAYADCDEVEFVLNGKSMGKVKTDELKAFIEIPYAPGTLEAIAWKGGKKAASDLLLTAGKAAKIQLSADRSDICGDGMDLSFIKIEITDEAGKPVRGDSVELSVKVEGTGTLAGFGSGNPKTEESYGTGKRFTFDGRALVCVRAGKTAGVINVEVSAEGLDTGKVAVHCK